ncbi:class I SAM-dependent methyltransferase [Catalinimonas niigatensis]|uniref:class I SAM-dependent methyltransferase n=1 Tax=Catalinimonas niigatensis TaxID=1397264 RepID=UPI0026666716|nr:class I SAM-dependent methyltransferase [Catalinimonas niigatensis]WPP51944.1 class I SAM-dependent methyltransferase [Catalinimonas niigatensis]
MKGLRKSSIQQIRERFDKDVERFSNLEAGQQSTIDAAISLDLITDAAKVINPLARILLDIGCGAGNYTLKMLSKIPDLDCTLLDLSMPMLDRAKERVSKQTNGEIKVIQDDIRQAQIPAGAYDIILAGAVLHHLRDKSDWEFVFRKIYNSLQQGGSFWISDLVIQDTLPVNSLIWHQYGNYLEKLGGVDYKKQVSEYIQKEDSPRSLNFQLRLMEKVGFKHVEILHKHLCFAAFGGVK